MCRAAQDLELATAMGIDALVLCEPYSCRSGVEGWFSDVGARTAIMVFNPGLQIRVIGLMDNTGFRWVKIEDITLYVCYWSPNTAYTIFIATGDFNAMSPTWGDHKEEPKRKALVDMTASLGLSVFNIGDKPTVSRVYAGGIYVTHRHNLCYRKE